MQNVFCFIIVVHYVILNGIETETLHSMSTRNADLSQKKLLGCLMSVVF